MCTTEVGRAQGVSLRVGWPGSVIYHLASITYHFLRIANTLRNAEHENNAGLGQT
jgi:hypothetical protein